MTINYAILGEPGRDNAPMVTIDSGQSQHRLLFDCGEGCLSKIPISEIREEAKEMLRKLLGDDWERATLEQAEKAVAEASHSTEN
ncbi:MAG: hypothetical protein H8E44_02520 [Planctomycetes bacterium]|nr:hypothetical protein [Planctomycetota bacterium]